MTSEMTVQRANHPRRPFVARRPFMGPAALSLVALLASACSSDDGKGTAQPDPNVSGKQDFTDRVSMQGDLEYAEPRAAGFTEDLEYHGYRFRAAAGARLTVEVTQRGSSRGLDTTLYVYGPRDGSTYRTRVAFDDDAGWGDLSKIADLELLAAGDYLVVVGTYGGLGRGNYRLLLECADDSCVDVDLPGDCPDTVEEDIHDCVEEWLAEGDYEDSRRDAFEACLTDFGGDFFEDSCDSPWRPPAAFCPAGVDSFLAEILPVCQTQLAPQFPDDVEPLALRYRALGAEVEAAVEGGNDGCDYSCFVAAHSYTYDAPSDGAAVDAFLVIESIRLAQEGPSMWSHNPTSGTGALASFLDSYDMEATFADLLLADAGASSYDFGHLSANYYVAAGAEAWEDLFVFHFDNGVVTVVHFGAGED